MFGIGVPELIVILVIILIIFGAGKLPEVGSAIGKSIREFQKAAGQIQEPTQTGQAAPVQPAQSAPPMQPVQPMPPALNPTGNSTPISIPRFSRRPCASSWSATSCCRSLNATSPPRRPRSACGPPYSARSQPATGPVAERKEGSPQCSD